MTDSATGRTTTYYYDLIDRIGKYVEKGANYEHSVAYTYDERNNLAELVENINDVEHVTDYTYDYENRLTETNYGDVSETVQYDDFGRLDSTTIKKDGETVIYSWTVYSSGETANTTTTQLAQFGFDSEIGYDIGGQYWYDNNGNIIEYAYHAEHWELNTPYVDILTRVGPMYYHYDTANQLVREDNRWLEKTFVWTYDNAGNITSRKEYAYTNPESTVTGEPIATYNYTYGDDSWGDLLTAYNGIARTYDQIGNVLTDGTWTYTWQNGRELAAMTDGTTTWSYTYDANGMRTSRTNGTKTYNYVYNGSQLTQMTVGNDTLYFTYGLLGPTTVTWNGTTYYYALNIQGDVVGIYDEAGNPVVTYNWDNAWGYNPIPEGVMASTLGELNPLRYRSYVYDTETGYYYLQSRYYDPKIGRFINVDVFASTGQGFIGHNMFAYCGNNPVNRADPSGHAFVQVCFDTDGGIQMLGPCMWGGGGGGGGGVAYAASAVSSFPKETVNKFWAKVGETIGSAAQACWDAYMFSSSLQAQETQLLLDGAKNVYSFLDENGTIDIGTVGYQSVMAAKEWQASLTYLAAPIPSPVDELLAAGHAIKAFYHWFKCAWEVVK